MFEVVLYYLFFYVYWIFKIKKFGGSTNLFFIYIFYFVLFTRILLINVTNNSIIVLMCRWDLQWMNSATSSSIEIWIASYIMTPSSFNVGLLKYNLLMDVMLGTPTVEHTFRVKMLNVQFSSMRKSFGLSHWNFNHLHIASFGHWKARLQDRNLNSSLGCWCQSVPCQTIGCVDILIVVWVGRFVMQ